MSCSPTCPLQPVWILHILEFKMFVHMLLFCPRNAYNFLQNIEKVIKCNSEILKKPTLWIVKASSLVRRFWKNFFSWRHLHFIDAYMIHKDILQSHKKAKLEKIWDYASSSLTQKKDHLHLCNSPRCWSNLFLQMSAVGIPIHTITNLLRTCNPNFIHYSFGLLFLIFSH